MSTKIRRLIMLVLTALFLVASGLLVEPLRQGQVRYDLTNAPVRGVSPGVVLATTALGAFRGIIVDVVWVRMEDLKNAGKFFEIVQLADLACRLAPTFPAVWDFNAWNLAYNVSVKVPRFDERWFWVRRGIELLRDQGILNNPTEPKLYLKLGWIYQHKIGQEMDDAHFVYKESLGLEMHEALGGGGSKEDLERFLNAPRTNEGLLQDRSVRAFYERCVAAGFDPLAETPDEGVLQFFSWVRRPESIPPEALKLMKDEANKYAVEQIAVYARAKRIREQLRLDPKKMIELVDKFGPFDWRSPYPHAMYWATEGLRVADRMKRHYEARPDKRGEQAADDIQWSSDASLRKYCDIFYDRIIYSSLQYLVQRGHFAYDSNGRLLPIMSPDFRFTEALIEQFERLVDKYKDDASIPGVNLAYENFLKTIALEFYYRGDERQSQIYFERLKRKYPKSEYRVSWEQFIDKEVKAYLGRLTVWDCRNFVTAALSRHYFFLGCGYDDKASIYYEKAKKIVAVWQEHNDQTLDRRLVDFNSIAEFTLLEIFSGRAGFPPEVTERLEQRLPVALVDKVKKAAEEQKQGMEAGALRTPEERRERPDLRYRPKEVPMP